MAMEATQRQQHVERSTAGAAATLAVLVALAASLSPPESALAKPRPPPPDPVHDADADKPDGAALAAPSIHPAMAASSEPNPTPPPRPPSLAGLGDDHTTTQVDSVEALLVLCGGGGCRRACQLAHAAGSSARPRRAVDRRPAGRPGRAAGNRPRRRQGLRHGAPARRARARARAAADAVGGAAIAVVDSVVLDLEFRYVAAGWPALAPPAAGAPPPSPPPPRLVWKQLRPLSRPPVLLPTDHPEVRLPLDAQPYAERVLLRACRGDGVELRVGVAELDPAAPLRAPDEHVIVAWLELRPPRAIAGRRPARRGGRRWLTR